MTTVRLRAATHSRLRHALEGERGDGTESVIATQGGGYVLRVAPDELDVARFERLAEEGADALSDGDPARALEVLGEALAVWRGPPLTEFAYDPFAQTEIARLEELRLGTVEQRIEAELALGRHAQVIGELESLVELHPFRERLRAHLMLALYRAGRQTEALDAYRQARQTLVNDIGVEPGEELRSLERAVLAQDPALDTPRPAPRSRLPSPPSRVIGRDEDCDRLAELLTAGDARLVTLVGPGGVGKTTLAIEVARRLEHDFADGAWFIELAPLAEASHVASAIAQTLPLNHLTGENAAQAVKRFLGPKHALVVLDNFEHVLPAAPFVSELVAVAPGVTVVTTSREALSVRAERRYAVAPLPVPARDAPVSIEETAATVLFAERARDYDPDLQPNEAAAAAIADICRRVDGLPLAIELAAARMSLLTPEELSASLADELDALGSGPRDAPARQRTLRATIDWSHRLLTAREAEVFARFSIFSGGATIDAAEEVTGADRSTLEALVEKQLLSRRSPDRSRLVMLETVREYARERLEADPGAAEAHLRHCLHYLQFAEDARAQLDTPAEIDWLANVAAEIDNLRGALDWSLHNGQPGLTLLIAALLPAFWNYYGMSAEGLGWADAALEAVGDDASLADRAGAVRAQAILGLGIGAQYDEGHVTRRARDAGTRAIELSRQVGDPRAIADALLAKARLDVAKPLPQLGRRALAEEALDHARAAGDSTLIAYALAEMALSVPPDKDATELERAVDAFRELGARRAPVWVHFNAGYNALKLGRPDLARPVLDRALLLARELGNPRELMFAWGNAGLGALFDRDPERARAAFIEQLRLCAQFVDDDLVAEGLGGMAAVAAGHGNDEHAARLLGAARALGAVADYDVMAQLELHFFEPARRRYGAERWNEAAAAGAELGFGEAIELALAGGAQSG